MNNGSEVSGLSIGGNGESSIEMRDLEGNGGAEFRVGFQVPHFEMPVRLPREDAREVAGYMRLELRDLWP